MTGQQLKNSILQMAVQGKLVPQDPNDEPASVLLERIKKEKEQLIKEGKIKKEKKPSYIFRGADNLPYEKVGKNEPVCIADEVPFEIPKSWEWVRLGSLCSVVTKGTTPRGGNVAYLNSGIGFLRAENVAGMDCLDTDKMNYINEETHSGYLKRSILFENDILITIAGTLGRTALVRKNDLPLNANQAISIVRLINTREMDLLYLIFALNSPLIQKKLTAQKKITAIPNLTLEIISDCFIPIPPFFEQCRIVAKIEELLPYIEKYKKAETQQEKLRIDFPDQLKKSILQEAVQGKLVPQDPSDEPASVLLERIRAEKERLIKEGKIKRDKYESIIFRRDNSHYEKCGSEEVCIDDKIPFEIPENWCWSKMGICLDVRDGTHDTPKYVAEGVPLITSKNLRNGEIDFSTAKFISKEDHIAISQRSKVDAGDIMYAMIGSIGNPALYNGNAEFSIKNMALFKKIANGLDMEFVYWFLYLSQDTMKKFASGGVQAFVSLEYLRNYWIPVPPIQEQYRIVTAIKQLLSKIHAL